MEKRQEKIAEIIGTGIAGNSTVVGEGRGGNNNNVGEDEGRMHVGEVDLLSVTGISPVKEVDKGRGGNVVTGEVRKGLRKDEESENREKLKEMKGIFQGKVTGKDSKELLDLSRVAGDLGEASKEIGRIIIQSGNLKREMKQKIVDRIRENMISIVRDEEKGEVENLIGSMRNWVWDSNRILETLVGVPRFSSVRLKGISDLIMKCGRLVEEITGGQGRKEEAAGLGKGVHDISGTQTLNRNMSEDEFRLVDRKRKRYLRDDLRSTESEGSPAGIIKKQVKRRLEEQMSGVVNSPGLINSGRVCRTNPDEEGNGGSLLGAARKQKEEGGRKREGGFLKIKCKEGATYEQTLRESKERIMIGSIRINRMRQTKGGREILFYFEEEEELCKFGDRVKGAGFKVEPVVGRRKKVMLTGIDLDISEDDLKGILRDEHRITDMRTIFFRKSLSGSNNACVELQEETADEFIAEGRIKVGWTCCKVSSYTDNRKCFRCGSRTHLAWSCKQEKKCVMPVEERDISVGTVGSRMSNGLWGRRERAKEGNRPGIGNTRLRAMEVR
ncbi:uncharacterized protein LOC143264119 [Megachile rotundata]|uniref:uncharacterized protein LOC143264119 n=1 Tax=Megachile rotundata TaxID=143995 RepID=UPI003FD625F7